MYPHDVSNGARETTSFHDGVSIGASERLGWNRTWGISSDDTGHGVWCDGNDTYTCGHAYFSASSTYDLFLVKWDSDGNQVWNRTWGGASTSDLCFGIWGDGVNIYTCGCTKTYGSGDLDILLIKWDLSGNVLWYRTWGGTGNDGSYGLWGDGAGGIYVGGYTYSSGASSNDLALVKWDTSGNLQWSRTWGGASVDSGFSVWCDVSGVYACGRTASYGMGSTDLMLVKWDATGNQLWNRTWGGTGVDQGWTVRGDGTSIYTCGNAHDASTNSWDMLLVKWDASGNQLWNRTWGGTAEEEAHALWVNGSTVYVSGCTMGSGAGMRDVVIVKWDASGNLLWFDLWGHAHNDVCWAMHGYRENVFCCGYTSTWTASGTDLVLVQWIDDGGLPRQTPPAITHPADLTYVIGQTGNSLTWTITDATTGTRFYTIYQDGYPTESGPWTSGTPVARSVDGLPCGSYNYTIVATDGLGGSVQDSAVVTVLTNTQPSITHPADITYAAGQTGNVISWTVTDATTGTRSYTIYRNGTSIASGTWSSGTPVAQNVDGLAPGGYNYTIVVIDGLGGEACDVVCVAVFTNLAPNIACTVDNDRLVISWTIIDASIGLTSYVAYKDGEVVANGTWISGMPVNVSTDGLATGAHNFTILAMDGLGAQTQRTALVVVVAPPPGHGDPPGEDPPGYVIIIVIILGAGMTVTTTTAVVKYRAHSGKRKAGRTAGVPAVSDANVNQGIKDGIKPQTNAAEVVVPSLMPTVATVPTPTTKTPLPTPKMCSRCGNLQNTCSDEARLCEFCGEPL
ncbi:MAG: hypothetical protein JW839_17000 [Candidatus Lokiarchaeota archaeon]|nr:hypothetical protein [Candidatus Lokiarchaeota archaeon]